jgi:hypothetical protein
VTDRFPNLAIPFGQLINYDIKAAQPSLSRSIAAE